MPVRVATPMDELGTNPRRTIPGYGFDYQPTYVEQEKEYLADLGKRIAEHVDSVGQPGHDPLGGPISFDTGGIAAITKGDMLKNLGRGMSKFMRDEGIRKGGRWANETVGKTRALANEIREAPEGLFDPLTGFEVTPVVNGKKLDASHYNPRSDTIVVHPEQAIPKTLRHETVHKYLDDPSSHSYEDWMGRAAYARDSTKIAEQGGFPVVKEMAQRANVRPEREYEFKYIHGYHPEEIAAVNMESFPLGKFEDKWEYLGAVQNAQRSAVPEAMRRYGDLFKVMRKQGLMLAKPENWMTY